MESVTYMPEALYAPPACGFVPPEGKTFQGWLVTAAGTGAQDPVSGLHFPCEPFILPGGGDVVLKAQWDGGASVTFSPGEGTGSMTAASELPFSFALHESAWRAVHEVKGQCTRPSGLDAESVDGRFASRPEPTVSAMSLFPCEPPREVVDLDSLVGVGLVSRAS